MHCVNHCLENIFGDYIFGGLVYRRHRYATEAVMATAATAAAITSEVVNIFKPHIASDINAFPSI